jgi:hypothetical protein
LPTTISRSRRQPCERHEHDPLARQATTVARAFGQRAEQRQPAGSGVVQAVIGGVSHDLVSPGGLGGSRCLAFPLQCVFSLARERNDVAGAQRAGEFEAGDASLEIATELLVDVARHGPLGGFPPLEPTLEVLRPDLVERRLLGAALLVLAGQRGAPLADGAEAARETRQRTRSWAGRRADEHSKRPYTTHGMESSASRPPVAFRAGKCPGVGERGGLLAHASRDGMRIVIACGAWASGSADRRVPRRPIRGLRGCRAGGSQRRGRCG